MGAVLSQKQGGEERVVAYTSKSLSGAERNYCITRRELLAVTVVIFLKKFKHYLWGRKGSLRWLCNFKNPEGQLARWMEVLESYDIELEYRPGRSHQNADGLSWNPCKQCGREEDGKVEEAGATVLFEEPDTMVDDKKDPPEQEELQENHEEVIRRPSCLKKQSDANVKTKRSVTWKPDDQLAEYKYLWKGWSQSRKKFRDISRI